MPVLNHSKKDSFLHSSLNSEAKAFSKLECQLWNLRKFSYPIRMKCSLNNLPFIRRKINHGWITTHNTIIQTDDGKLILRAIFQNEQSASACMHAADLATSRAELSNSFAGRPGLALAHARPYTCVIRWCQLKILKGIAIYSR